MKPLCHYFAYSFASGLIILAGCSTPPSAGPGSAAIPPSRSSASGELPHENLNAVLYMKTAVEYQVICRMTYDMATRQMLTCLQPHPAVVPAGSTAYKKNAVILDIDETVLDNGPYQEEAVLRGLHSFDPKLWKEWSQSQPKAQARAISGAIEFITNAMAHDVQVVFITNRRESEGSQTLLCLSQIGVDTNRIILMMAPDDGKKPDKSKRRSMVDGQYRLLLSVGDDLADFISIPTNTPAARMTEANRYSDHWGVSWFLLPNPTYGSWESSVSTTNQNLVISNKFQYLKGFSR